MKSGINLRGALMLVVGFIRRRRTAVSITFSIEYENTIDTSLVRTPLWSSKHHGKAVFIKKRADQSRSVQRILHERRKLAVHQQRDSTRGQFSHALLTFCQACSPPKWDYLYRPAHNDTHSMGRGNVHDNHFHQLNCRTV